MRYFTKANLPLYVEPHWDDEPQRYNLTVSDHRPIDTGLLDCRGDTIWRAPEQIGFHHPTARS